MGGVSTEPILSPALGTGWWPGPFHHRLCLPLTLYRYACNRAKVLSQMTVPEEEMITAKSMQTQAVQSDILLP